MGRGVLGELTQDAPLRLGRVIEGECDDQLVSRVDARIVDERLGDLLA